MVVTKLMLLSGKDFTKEVEIKSLNGSVIIRPLDSLKQEKVNEIRYRGCTLKGNGLVATDGSLVSKNEVEAQAVLVSLGLVEPALTVEEVKLLPFSVTTEIATEILQISGIYEGAEEAVNSFREE